MAETGDSINSITVREFYTYGRKNWQLKLLAGGEGLNKVITSARVQKTGLALANFLECSTRERVQLLGNTEMQYLRQLDNKVREQTLENLLGCDLACFVVTAGNTVPEYLVEAMERNKTPLFSTKIDSNHIIDLITHFLDYLLAPRQNIHGDLLDIFGLGVLLVGDSGVGKSECALELIARGHRLVADDIVEIKLVENEILIGSCPEHIRYLMEVRGIGLIDIKDLFGVGSVRESKKIELVVKLEHWREGEDYTRLGISDLQESFFGIDIPCIAMPVAPGRNLSILVEVAARNQLLKIKGINVAKRVSRRLDRALRKDKDTSSVKKVIIEGAGLFE
jgi:HPr kinase/phosphorylase